MTPGTGTMDLGMSWTDSDGLRGSLALSHRLNHAWSAYGEAWGAYNSDRLQYGAHAGVRARW